MKIKKEHNFLKDITYPIKNGYYRIRGWIKHFFRKDTFNLIKQAINGREWDESFLYELEQAKITQMANYIERNKRFEGWEKVVRDMRICCNLIDIFLEKRDLFHYDGKINFLPIENSENYELDGSNLKYYCDVNVNTKNATRFVPFGDKNPNIDFWIEHPHEIYVLKAKALYHKIRLERDKEWWD